MASRWVKLYRSVMEHPAFAHAGVFKLWIYLLLNANWKPKSWLIPGTLKRIEIGRGQLITGQASLHNSMYHKKSDGTAKRLRHADITELQVSPRTVWRWLKAIEAMGCIKVETVSSRCSLITICNYESYQKKESSRVTPASGSCHADVKVVSRSCHADVKVASTTLEGVEGVEVIEGKERKKQKMDFGRGYSEQFIQFWNIFPPIRKGSKPLAWKAWLAAIERETPETILKAAGEFAASSLAKSEFCPGPAPWLNQDRWEDDRAAWGPKPNQQPANGSEEFIAKPLTLEEIRNYKK